MRGSLLLSLQTKPTKGELKKTPPRGVVSKDPTIERFPDAHATQSAGGSGGLR